jgi:hypothetical protein
MTAVWRSPVQATLYLSQWVMCAHLAGDRGPMGGPRCAASRSGSPPKARRLAASCPWPGPQAWPIFDRHDIGGICGNRGA